jgi:hypothetical protein
MITGVWFDETVNATLRAAFTDLTACHPEYSDGYSGIH